MVMPEKMHRALAAQAKKKGPKGERRDAYVYGTMQKHKTKKRGK